MQAKIESNTIFTNSDVEKYAQAFFNPKGTQAAMSSALKPAFDKFKTRYFIFNIANVLFFIKNIKNFITYIKNLMNLIPLFIPNPVAPYS